MLLVHRLFYLVTFVSSSFFYNSQCRSAILSHFYQIFTMKSYIRHLSSNDCLSKSEHDDLSRKDPNLREGKRRVLARSLSDPLLQVPGLPQQPRRRGGKRPQRTRGVQRSTSFDGEFTVKVDSVTNAHRPTRRGSINKTETSTAPPADEEKSTTLVSAIRHRYNAVRPARRGSMEQQSNSCPEFSTATLPEAPAKTVASTLRLSQSNLIFRAEILYNALDDMGLFDDEDHSSSMNYNELSPRILTPLQTPPHGVTANQANHGVLPYCSL